MREDWQTVKLESVSVVSAGNSAPQDKSLFEGGENYFIRTSDVGKIKTGCISGSEDKLNSEGIKKLRLFPKETILLPKSGASTWLNHRVVMTRDGYVSSHLATVSPDKSLTAKNFLFYYLQLVRAQDLMPDNNYPSLRLSDIKGISVPLPPLPEQERIVSILDKAFEGIDQAIAQTEQNLASARELFESYLNNIFTQKGDDWVEKKLGDVCDFLNGFAFKSADTVTKSDVQLIRMGNLYQNVLDLDRKPAFYPSRFKDDHSRYLLSEGDFIISLTGTVDKEDYGYTVEIPDCSHSLLLNQRIAKFTNFSDDIYKRFLLYFLRSRVFLDELYASARGVRQANLSTVTMKELSVFFPDVDSQRKLVGKFDNLRAQTYQLIALYTQKLNDLKELKQSLLQQAFAGELTKEVAA